MNSKCKRLETSRYTILKHFNLTSDTHGVYIHSSCSGGGNDGGNYSGGSCRNGSSRSITETFISVICTFMPRICDGI